MGTSTRQTTASPREEPLDPFWILQRAPALEAAAASVWAMTKDERVAAMYAGRLNRNELFEWARARPHEVPVLNGEWWFIAVLMPEVADASGSS